MFLNAFGGVLACVLWMMLCVGLGDYACCKVHRLFRGSFFKREALKVVIMLISISVVYLGFLLGFVIRVQLFNS